MQRRDEPATVHKIAISENAENCDAVSVENVTAKDVVLSCMPEKGLPGPNHKFIYDIRSKSLVKEFTFARFELQRTFSADGCAVLVCTNSQRPIAIKYSPGHNPAFRILDSADVRPESKPTPRFGPDNSFSIANGRYGPLVVERTGKATKRYPLPQTSYDEFARARPARVANGYVRQATIIEEDIGPWQGG